MKQSQTCLSAESLRQLALGQMSPAQIHDFEQHITDCRQCRELLVNVESDFQATEDIRLILGTPEQFAYSGNDDRQGDHGRHDVDVESVTSILRLLGPTDNENMLGRIGLYEIVGVIGRGGMGVVFKAFDGPLNRFVAIKMLMPHLAASGPARRRFAREGQAAAAVVDDNVMPIYCVSEWQGMPYLVTQYCSGVTLQNRIQQQGPLDTKEMLRIGLQTARGLAAAHAQGLVHRDVKPSNILLDGTVERAMLTDFGLARAVDDASITRTGVITGTPQYMSPEQACGGTVDARSDLFGLGCVLYTACTGRPPFRGDSSYAVLRMITDEQARPVRDINPDVPEWLSAIIDKLMSKQPAGRYESADQVADLLEGCLAHVQQPTTVPLPESARTCVPSITQRIDQPWTRLLLVFAGGILLFLASVLIVLELNKGTLSIECEVDHVPIRIMQGEHSVKQMTVTQSGRSVRVAAGQYRVEIDGDINDVLVEDSVVSLQRGGTETIRIVQSDDYAQRRLVNAADAEGNSEPPTAAVLSEDPGLDHGRITVDIYCGAKFLPGMNKPGANVTFLKKLNQIDGVVTNFREAGPGADITQVIVRDPFGICLRESQSTGKESDRRSAINSAFKEAGIDHVRWEEQALTDAVSRAQRRSPGSQDSTDVQPSQPSDSLMKGVDFFYRDFLWSSLRSHQQKRDELLSSITACEQAVLDFRQPEDIPADADTITKERSQLRQELNLEKVDLLHERIQSLRSELQHAEQQIALLTTKLNEMQSSRAIRGPTDRTPLPVAGSGDRVVGPDFGASIYNEQLKRFKFRLERIQVTSAAEVAQEFVQLYRQRGNPPLKGVWGDPQTNSLVVVGPPEADQAIRDTIALWEGLLLGVDLDDESLESQQEKLRLRHRRALSQVASCRLEIIEATAAGEEPDGKQLGELNERLETETEELELIEHKLRIIDESLQRLHRNDAEKPEAQSVDVNSKLSQPRDVSEVLPPLTGDLIR